MKEKELLEKILQESRAFHSNIDRLPFSLGQLRTAHKLILQGYNIENTDLTAFLKGEEFVHRTNREGDKSNATSRE